MPGLSYWSSQAGRELCGHKCPEMPWVWKKTGARLRAAVKRMHMPLNLLSESPLVTTPFLTGICLIFSFLLRSFLFYPPVSSGACRVWFWSSNWLLPFNPFWFPQNENWPMPCLCYPVFPLCHLILLVFHLPVRLNLPFPQHIMEEICQVSQTLASLTFPREVLPRGNLFLWSSSSTILGLDFPYNTFYADSYPWISYW